ncbi:MAG TPA: hypothetical protein VMI73_17840 [Trebonia sp.]|nr:hypothetical protein [Trebonia sp.]
MGKASKKKAQRRQGTGQSRADFEEARPASQPERQLTQFDVSPDSVRDLVRYAARHGDDPHVTRAAWGWDPGSVGHRFFSDPVIADTRDAPSLEKARFPRPAKFAVSPGHWENAVSVLARAVALDEAPRMTRPSSSSRTCLARSPTSKPGTTRPTGATPATSRKQGARSICSAGTSSSSRRMNSSGTTR